MIICLIDDPLCIYYYYLFVECLHTGYIQQNQTNRSLDINTLPMHNKRNVCESTNGGKENSNGRREKVTT